MVAYDPEEMVEDLRRRADDLRRQAQRLLDAATVIEIEHGSNTATPTIAAPGERLKQLVQFLKDHGPKRRSEMAKDSGVPKGTISHLLKDKSHFKQLDDGRWYAAEIGEPGLLEQPGLMNPTI